MSMFLLKILQKVPIPYLFITNNEGLIEEDKEASTVQNGAPVTSRRTICFMTVYMINEKDESTIKKSLDGIGKTIKEVQEIIKKSKILDNEENFMSEKLTDLVSKTKQMTKNGDGYSIASSLIPN